MGPMIQFRGIVLSLRRANQMQDRWHNPRISSEWQSANQSRSLFADRRGRQLRLCSGNIMPPGSLVPYTPSNRGSGTTLANLGTRVSGNHLLRKGVLA